ncbi:MAG: zinc chelation protein SecC [Chlamydiae bacterium]|nr:zinc chelation protein SecC [Chlamydiota bacterium]
MHPCPCGSKKEYKNCCQKIIDGKVLPETAEQLMRSRYSAFTQQKIDYLKKTSSGRALENFSFKQTYDFAMQAMWHGLTIIKSIQTEEPNISYVEFIADFSIRNKKSKIHELSRFDKINGVWYYVDGKHIE